MPQGNFNKLTVGPAHWVLEHCYCCCDIWLASRELEAWLLPLLQRRQFSMFWTRESVKILHSLQSSYLLIPRNPYNSPDFVGNILERKVKISLFFLTSGRLFGLLERSFPQSSPVGRLDFSSAVYLQAWSPLLLSITWRWWCGLILSILYPVPIENTMWTIS